MFPKKLDRRQIERAMRQMGVRMKEIEGVREVLIRLSDREIVLPNPQVTLTELAGQRTYQVVGEEFERVPEFTPTPEDVELVAEQTGADRERAERALRETKGNIAEAILRLKGQSPDSGAGI